MKLNLRIIQDNLPNNYQTRYFGPEDRTLSLTRPLLYETGCEFHAGKLYIALSEALPPTPTSQKISIICIGGHIDQSWLTSGIPLLQILNMRTDLPVFNQVHEIFNKFDEWDEQLRDELENEENFDIRRLLQVGSKVLENPISVTDHALQIIFHSDFVELKNGGFAIEISDTPFPLPIEIGERVKEVCHLERIITVPYLSSMKGEEPILSYCNNLYPMGHFTGCVALTETRRSFRESDFPLADHFFACFQKAFLKHLRNFSQIESPEIAALRNLLDHRPLSRENRAQFSLLPGESLVCFKLKENRSEKYMPKDYMYATLNALMPRTVYAIIHHDEIVGLLRLCDGEGNQTMNLFQDLLKRMNYTGGLSNRFSDMEKFEDYYLQADYAAELSIRNPKETVCFFHDCILQYMLYECTGKLPMESLYSQGLQTLIDYDKKKNTDYVKTLNIYLKNEMSISKTSDALFIHRSSLLKRLDKMKRLLGSDLNDSNVRLYYRICFALWESGYGSKPENII